MEILPNLIISSDTFVINRNAHNLHKLHASPCFRVANYKNTDNTLCRETYLGKASKQYVFLVSGKATLMPEVRGEWRTTAAHSNRDAKSTVGTVPILCPYKMMFSGLMPYLQHTQAQSIFQIIFVHKDYRKNFSKFN